MLHAILYERRSEESSIHQFYTFLYKMRTQVDAGMFSQVYYANQLFSSILIGYMKGYICHGYFYNLANSEQCVV